PWEVNLGKVLTQGNGEWTHLFLGTRPPSLAGRYGRDGKPATAGNTAAPRWKPHTYGQVDWDAANEGPNGYPTAPIQLPGFGGPAFGCFPSVPPGYGNGSLTERLEHPQMGNAFAPAGDDRVFAASNLEALLRSVYTCSGAM